MCSTKKNDQPFEGITTNYEAIKAMSPEEMTDFLFRWAEKADPSIDKSFHDVITQWIFSEVRFKSEEADD